MHTYLVCIGKVPSSVCEIILYYEILLYLEGNSNKKIPKRAKCLLILAYTPLFPDCVPIMSALLLTFSPTTHHLLLLYLNAFNSCLFVAYIIVALLLMTRLSIT